MFYYKIDQRNFFLLGVSHSIVSTCLFALITFNFLSCSGPSEPEPGEVNSPPNHSVNMDSLYDSYVDDAMRLAVRFLCNTRHPDTAKVNISENLIELFHYGLRVIASDTVHAETDSVVALYKIHTFPDPALHSVVVGVDSTADWFPAWQSGSELTGNPAIDSLINQHNLSLVKLYKIIRYYAKLETDNPINTIALADKFEKIQGVRYAWPSLLAAGDGNDITASIERNSVIYEYTLGWGDCPSGCMNRYIWRFEVGFDGTLVNYGGEPKDQHTADLPSPRD